MQGAAFALSRLIGGGDIAFLVGNGSGDLIFARF
jgi:hypothetical protein